MGFFKWLSKLFKGNKGEIEEYSIDTETQQPSSLIQEQEPFKKPPYQKVPRTTETKAYVNSIIKKAKTPDLKPEPHREKVDIKKVEKFVDKIQGRK